MPPKKGGKNEPSKKTEQKKKDKIIEKHAMMIENHLEKEETAFQKQPFFIDILIINGSLCQHLSIQDKTFGLKNKKGAKQQKYIKTVTHQVKNAGTKTKMEELNKPKEKDKDKKKKELDELNMLFKPVQQSVGKGVDPKSVLCAFFKQGTCTKGDKCKFSHDLNVSRKTEKRNIYEDVREDDKMEDWDEQKLEEVVNKKHGESDKNKQKTTIICKYFLEAVENGKYGWFWNCPNGGNNCIYRHALPPGFVLKKDQQKGEKKEEISIEELVERERAALGPNTTKVTLETFLKWKERKKKEKLKALKDSQSKKKQDFTQGKMLGISGREMFEFNPDLVVGDDAEASETALEREVEDDDDDVKSMAVQDINVDMFVPTEVDNSGTQTKQSLKNGEEPPGMCNGDVHDGEDGKMDEAGALPPTAGAGDMSECDAAIAMAMAATKNGDTNIEIDEELFDGEDLDLVEEDLETLDLED